MSKEQTKKMRIRLKAYDHVVLEQAATKIVEVGNDPRL